MIHWLTTVHENGGVIPLLGKGGARGGRVASHHPPPPPPSEEGSHFHGSRSSRQRHPETIKRGWRRIAVARASRPLWRRHPFAALRAGSARAWDRDAPATAGETPALRRTVIVHAAAGMLY